MKNNKKIKILFSQHFSFGGGLININYTANHLVALGHEVTCVYIKNRLAQKAPPLPNNPKYKIIWLRSLPIITFLVLNRFLKFYLKKNKIDVIISTGPEGAYLKRICSKNSILHLASYHHSNLACKGLRVFLPSLKLFNPKNIGRWLWRWNSYFERLRLLKADIVRCVSSESQKNTTSIGIPKDKTVIIYNGADLEKFFPDSTRKELRILYCGGLLPNKGIDVLLRTLPRVIKKHNNIIVDILGEGGEWSLYKKMIEDSGIAKNVQYHGHIPHKRISKYYQRAFLFIAPTQHEGFSLSVLEAMASGLPVVATSIISNLEMIEDKISGLLVPWKDSKALAEAIINLLDNPEAAELMGKAGRKRVEELFSWEKSALRIEKIMYEQLVKFNQQ